MVFKCPVHRTRNHPIASSCIHVFRYGPVIVGLNCWPIPSTFTFHGTPGNKPWHPNASVFYICMLTGLMYLKISNSDGHQTNQGASSHLIITHRLHLVHSFSFYKCVCCACIYQINICIFIYPWYTYCFHYSLHFAMLKK